LAGAHRTTQMIGNVEKAAITFVAVLALGVIAVPVAIVGRLSTADLLSGLQLISVVANIGLLIVAILALEQIRVAKADLSTRVQRETAKEASAQLSIWATEIISPLRK
jgi:hypothetical protein